MSRQNKLWKASIALCCAGGAFSAACRQPPRSVSRDPQLGVEHVLLNSDAALQVEPTLSRRGKRTVFAWNGSLGALTPGALGTTTLWAVTDDAGTTVSAFGHFPTRTFAVPSGADPRLATLRDGSTLLVNLSIQDSSQFLLASRLKPGEREWSEPVVLARSPLVDKPDLAVDDRGVAHIVVNVDWRITHLMVPASNLRMPPAIAVMPPDSARPLVGHPGVATCGPYVLAGWRVGARQASFALPQILVALSRDRGATWSAPRDLAGDFREGISVSGARMSFGRVNPGSDVELACETTRSGDLTAYLATSARSASGELVRVVRGHASAGAELTWEAAQTIVPEDSTSQLFPSLALLPDGTPVLLYYANRRPNGETVTRLSWLERGIWRTITMSAQPSLWSEMRPDTASAKFQRNIGDYITIAADGWTLHAAWTAERGGKPRIFHRAVRFRSP